LVESDTSIAIAVELGKALARPLLTAAAHLRRHFLEADLSIAVGVDGLPACRGLRGRLFPGDHAIAIAVQTCEAIMPSLRVGRGMGERREQQQTRCQA